MKQYKSVVVFLVAVAAGAAIAYPAEPEQPESTVDLTDAVDEAVRLQIDEYMAIIAETVKAPKLEGNLEAIKELIGASFPESLRQDVATELSDEAYDGTLSDGLEERIRQHILDWLLQYVPKDLRVDIASVLEEYRATGQVSGNNEDLAERIRLYAASLETRTKRGFWKGLFNTVAIYCLKYVGTLLFGFFG